MTLLERYQNGEHEAVWTELNALGEGVRARRVRDDARAVANETMRRARRNIEILVPRLREIGYKFQDKKPFVPPGRKTDAQIKKLEKILGGPLPLSLAAWWEQVGEVSFLGSHPVLSAATADPLVFAPIDYAVEAIADWAGNQANRAAPPQPAGLWMGSVEAWRRSLTARGVAAAEIEALLAPTIAMFEAQDREYDKLRALPDDRGFHFDFAPDELHKAGVSGATYDVVLPNPSADFPLEGANGNPLFVDYLRAAFRGGGFTAWGVAPPELDFLTRDILLF